MIPVHLSPLANHLWQSTLFAGVAATLALVLKEEPCPYALFAVAFCVS
jgi:hypothetical protein